MTFLLFLVSVMNTHLRDIIFTEALQMNAVPLSDGELDSKRPRKRARFGARDDQMSGMLLVPLEKDEELRGGRVVVTAADIFSNTELRLSVFEFLSPVDFVRATEACGSSMILAAKKGDLQVVRSFVERFDMSALLQEYFKISQENGREEMASFVSRYFLDHDTGAIRFRDEVLHLHPERKFKERMFNIKNVVVSTLQNIRPQPGNPIPNTAFIAAAIAGMDLDAFLEHLQIWLKKNFMNKFDGLGLRVTFRGAMC